LISSDRVQFPVSLSLALSLSIFREFICALDWNAIKITDPNFIELEEFCFIELAAKLSEFRPSINFKEGATNTSVEDVDACGRIVFLEEKANQHSNVIAKLQDKVIRLSTGFGRFVCEVSSVQSVTVGIQTLSEEVSALKTQIAQKLNGRVVEQFSTDFIELRKEVLTQKVRIAALSLHLRISRLLHLLLGHLHSSHPFRRSIRGSFLTFRRSSQSSERTKFRFCGGAVAMVSKDKNFIADMTVRQTL
jgi:hypothetical protein